MTIKITTGHTNKVNVTTTPKNRIQITSGGGGGGASISLNDLAPPFIQANAAFLRANAAYSFANVTYSYANVIFNHANLAFNTANSSYDIYKLIYGQANLAYNRANNSVLRTGDSMTGSLFFSSNNMAVGPIQSGTGIDLYANTGMDWAQLNYNNTNFVWVDSQGSYLSGTEGAIYIHNQQQNIEIQSGTGSWFFSNTSSFIFPDNTYQNTAYQTIVSDTANSAYTKANNSNTLAYDVSIGSNAWSNSVGTATNNYASILISNTAIGANGWANTIGSSSNSWSNSVGLAANSYATATYYAKSGGTISGDVAITGNVTISKNLNVTGNVTFTNSNSLVISDPLIYLAGNNYSSDIVDIGFVANYVNTGGSNVHTGLYRSYISKQYYLFQEYNKEPYNNYIDFSGNNFTLAVLNADLISSNLTLGGVNTINWISNSYNKANTANLLAYDTSIGANAWANSVGTAANNYAASLTPNLSAANTWANTVGTAGNNYASILVSNTAIGANGWANTVGTAANNYAASLTPNLSAANTWANTVGTAGNNYASILVANNAIGDNAWSNTVGTAGNNYTNITVNTRIGYSNTWANTVANYANIAANGWANTIGLSANNWANNKLANTTGTTFNGNLVVSGNLNAGNVIVSGQTTFISANSVTIGVSEVNSISIITSTTNDQTIDSFSASNYRAAQYMVSMNAGTDYEVTQINLIHNDSDAFITEFGTILTTSNLLGTFSASYTSGNVRLNIVPTFATTTIRMLRMTNIT